MAKINSRYPRPHLQDDHHVQIDPKATQEELDVLHFELHEEARKRQAYETRMQREWEART